MIRIVFNIFIPIILASDDLDVRKVVWDEIFERGVPPKKLDFKLSSLKPDCRNLLQESKY
jgi:hypothetical protein